MNNPFQEQLLKAGVVTKKQVQKAQQEKSRKSKNKQPKSKKKVILTEAQISAKQANNKKAERDRELNKKKEAQARQKANSIEINQLIINNRIERDDSCEIAYNFEHNRKVKHIYIDAEMKQKIIEGKLGIARIEGRYELVPFDIAEKIKNRNEKRIILFTQDEEIKNDDYSADEHQIPDDLIW